MRNRYLLLADVLAISLAAWGAFAFRFGWLFFDVRPEFSLFFIVALPTKLALFYAFGVYRRYWRFAGFWDLMSLVLANTVASAVMTVVMVGARLTETVDALSRAVLPLDWLLGLCLTVGIRATVRAISETSSVRRRPDATAPKSVLIVGAGHAGALIAREMQRNPGMGLLPVAFLDDDPGKQKHEIHGLPVAGPLSSLRDVAPAHGIDEVVLALPSSGGAALRQVVEQCAELGLESRVMPGIYELLDGQINVSRLRHVEIADLLRRPQFAPDGWDGAYLRDAVVLVTGAGGSIGSELCRQLATTGPKRIVLLGHGENSIFAIAAELRTRYPHLLIQDVIADVRDRTRIQRVFKQVKPDVVFHAAAHKHVPLMEANPAEAITNNVLGTRNVVDAAVAVGSQRFVLVSSDKAAGPANLMGASKRIAELIVQQAARQRNLPYVVVRFGNVLGSRGSVVPIFRAQIERGGPVTVTHPDVRRYFMTIPEAAHLILQSGDLGLGGELFVLDMGEPVRLRDIAADMIRLSGLRADEIDIRYTGLRPGEKLDEILWEDGAQVISTSRRDIRLVREPLEVSDALLSATIDRLTQAAVRDDRASIVEALHQCLPTADPILTAAVMGPRAVASVVSGSSESAAGLRPA
jgi:FlaA1/EpsC-like NDP-sugar epimerase